MRPDVQPLPSRHGTICRVPEPLSCRLRLLLE